MQVKKAIFPVAGLGTRFLPATKSSPKEMLPLIDKPLVQYVVEEAVASGIEQLLFVTGRSKRAIEDHFDISFELEALLQEKGKDDMLQEVREIADMVKSSTSGRSRPWGSATPSSAPGNSWATSPSRSCWGTTSSTRNNPAWANSWMSTANTGARSWPWKRCPSSPSHPTAA